MKDESEISDLLLFHPSSFSPHPSSLRRLLRLRRGRLGRGQQDQTSGPVSLSALQPDRSAAGFHPPQCLGQPHPPSPAGGPAAEERIERSPKRVLVHPA